MRRLQTPAGRLAALWAGTALAAVVTLPWWDTLLSLAPGCRFKQLTGRPCLTCGTSRALRAAAQGHPGEALAANPLAVVSLALLVAGGIAAAAWLAGWGSWKGPSPGAARRVAWAALALLAANWIYLLLHTGG